MKKEKKERINPYINKKGLLYDKNVYPRTMLDQGILSCIFIAKGNA